MVSHNIRRLLLIIAAMMLIFATAASAATVMIMEDTTVYAKPDKDSKSYGVLEAGTKLTMTDSGYGWAELKAGKSVGYVDLDDVAKVKSFDGETVYVNGGATLQKDFDSDSAIMDLEHGAAVKLYSTAGDWAYIKVGSKSGLVKVDDLVTKKPEVVEEEVEEEPAQTMTAYVANDGAKAYKSASKSSKVLKRMAVNEIVTVTAVKNGWAKVEQDGGVGYMKVSDLSTEKIDVIITEGYSGYAAKDGVKCYDDWNGNGSAVKTLKVNTKIEVQAYNSTWARVKVDGGTYFMYVSSISKTKINTIPDNGSTVMPATGTAKEADWWTSGIATKFKVGDVVTVTDVATGIAWRVKRVGGTNHADVAPLTAEDTAAMKKVYGTWSWNRRAVFVTIDGVNYAASINGMPHGSGDSVPDNNYNGHHCMHFTNSRTHGTNKECSLHQAAIQKALKAVLD